MARVRKNNAEDFRAVRGISRKPGIQNGITTTIINQRKQLERAEKRSTVLKYATECLKKGEDKEKVRIKSRLYAIKLNINPESITDATMEMLLNKIQSQRENKER